MKSLAKLVQKHQPDVILTTSPPHSIHQVGLSLQRQFQIPWVADFRDPFLMDHRYEPRRLVKINTRRFQNYERRIVTGASACLTAIPAHYERLCKRFPEERERFTQIPNGFPAEMTFRKAGSSVRPIQRMVAAWGDL